LSKERPALELEDLIARLARPTAYLGDLSQVEVRQTHISVVFLAGEFAYKLKKPVRFGFVDYGTLERRRHFCTEEVRLNRRLAPQVYLGVVPITFEGDQVRVEGRGEPIEWAVKMRRLPDEARLKTRLLQGEIGADHLTALASKLAAFHRDAASGPGISRFGRFEVVSRNALENFDQSASQVGVTVSPEVFVRLRRLTEQALKNLHDLIESRASRDLPRETHGDLRLDHVYLFPQQPPPNDLIIIDGIEFSERLRHADPIADMAFLAMDLVYHGRRDLARSFVATYLHASGDSDGQRLVPFYLSYRAAVRGKVEGMKLDEPEIPDQERLQARIRSQAHWIIALEALEEPGRRPALILIGGLPGTGKSTLARGLASRAGFQVLRTDQVRKALARDRGSSLATDGGIYTTEWNDRTYAACLSQAEEALSQGRRVVVDASFREEARRRAFLEAASRLGVPAHLLLCQAHPEVIKDRLNRRQGDASDADWNVYQLLATEWEEPSNQTRSQATPIPTAGSQEIALTHALTTLRRLDLLDQTGPPP
jgi:hypothetical protein